MSTPTCYNCARQLVVTLAVIATNALAQIPPNLPGAIAYISAGQSNYLTELHLVQPDGSNDRVIWTDPFPGLGGAIQPAWKPDGTEITFMSSYEAACSYYDRNIYAIRPNGAGFRRLTNRPTCSELGSYSKGSVTVQVENQITNFSQFILVVEGVADGLPIVVNPGFVRTVTVPNVADFGPNVLQRIVVVNGNNRWINPLVNVDVQAGQTVSVSNRLVINATPVNFNQSYPTWRSDGSQIAFLQGSGAPYSIAANPPLLDAGFPLVAPGSVLANGLAWSPKSTGNIWLMRRVAISATHR